MDTSHTEAKHADLKGRVESGLLMVSRGGGCWEEDGHVWRSREKGVLKTALVLFRVCAARQSTVKTLAAALGVVSVTDNRTS